MRAFRWQDTVRQEELIVSGLVAVAAQTNNKKTTEVSVVFLYAIKARSCLLCGGRESRRGCCRRR